MDISVNAHVDCSDGSFGRTTYIILQPNTRRVTHVVAERKHGAHKEYLVPIGLIEESSPDTILLRCARREVEAMGEFAETRYAVVADPAFVAGVDAALLTGAGDEPMVLADEEIHVPEGEIALTSGVLVVATDGPVGRLGELMVDGKTGKATHLVLQEGHIWRHKRIVIPIPAVDHIASTAIYLTLAKQDIEGLPTDKRRYSLA
ncbi:MAG: hypothetical protein R2844_00135 [Caldilineales bacterium]